MLDLPEHLGPLSTLQAAATDQGSRKSASHHLPRERRAFATCLRARSWSSSSQPSAVRSHGLTEPFKLARGERSAVVSPPSGHRLPRLTVEFGPAVVDEAQPRALER